MTGYELLSITERRTLYPIIIHPIETDFIPEKGIRGYY